MQLPPIISQQPELLWRFLGIFQKPCARVLHAAIVILVLFQIISSNWMHFSAPDTMDPATTVIIASWYHIIAGLSVVTLAVLQVSYSLWTKGPRHFFPYLWKDNEQLKKDILDSLHFKMVAPRPKGLAATVQGLGMGALLLTSCSGLVWMLLWLKGANYAEVAGTVRSIHKELSFLLELYFVGHGSMALLHFGVWQREINKKQSTETRSA